MIDKHTTETLEFPKIVDLIAGKCLTVYGKGEVAGIAPMADPDLINSSLDEISQMRDIINFGTAFPLYRMEEDCGEYLRESQVEGMFLDPLDMLKIEELVAISIGFHNYEKENRENIGEIDRYLRQIRAFPELRDQIRKVVDEDGNIRDNASSKLKGLRADLHESRRKIIARLDSILSERTKRPGWQDDVITQRNDRFVIPVPSSEFSNNLGILHDRSQSGATLFVEPNQTVELNNRIHLLMQEERLEIDRILRALTQEIARRSEPLLENIRLIGRLDRIHACAIFGNEIHGQRPGITDDAAFNLIDARHPLLIMQSGGIESVVPTTIGLDQNRSVVLVTGPNTGGKTISLKTIGLSILMAMSGLHISAGDKSVVGLFSTIHADIGDEQSIELSLSTFSSHIKNIIRGLENASPTTLLLLDEIGAGTDPREGAALAEAIILHAIGSKSRMIATTHYSQLKTLAMDHPEIENASLEFDRETLAPTYRLLLGLPGSSFAVEIAGRLGMPRSICERASQIIGTGEKSLSDLIASLETELAHVKEDRKNLSNRLEKVKQQQSEYETKLHELETDVETKKRTELDETTEYLAQTRRDIEKLVADIRKSQASKDAVKEFHHQLKGREEGLGKRRSKKKPRVADSSVFEVGDRVTLLSLNKDGEIDSLMGNDRARVRVGNITTTAALRDLRKIDGPLAPKLQRSSTSFSSDEDISPEIHLRGMTGDEAIDSLEKFIDRAIVAGLGQIYVVHGKGTGALRRKLTDYLNGHAEVASLRLGNWNEGGAGVTIVKLKR